MVEKATKLEQERDKKQAQDEQMVAQRLKASLGPQIWIPRKERRRESDQLQDGGGNLENGAAGEGERLSTENLVLREILIFLSPVSFLLYSPSASCLVCFV
jgi:hypothetical protein